MQKIEIKKPLYGNFCYISERFLKNAIRNGELVEITLPTITAVVRPKEWIKTGKRMAKVFNFPDNPMILWGNEVKPMKVKPRPPLPQTEEEWMIAVGAL